MCVCTYPPIYWIFPNLCYTFEICYAFMCSFVTWIFKYRWGINNSYCGWTRQCIVVRDIIPQPIMKIFVIEWCISGSWAEKELQTSCFLMLILYRGQRNYLKRKKKISMQCWGYQAYRVAVGMCLVLKIYKNTEVYLLTLNLGNDLCNFKFRM